MSRDHVPVRGCYNGFGGVGAINQHIIDVGRSCCLVHAKAGSSVGLRVKIAYKNTGIQAPKGGSQVYTGCSFAYSALLIHNCNGL